MEIIPVLDLKAGVVVHARGGRRDAYRPIVTPLAAGSAPGDIVAGLCRVVPARRLYIADLDAIEGHGSQAGVLRALGAQYPALEFWVDAGLRASQAREWLAEYPGCAVIGSESQPDAESLRALRDEPRVILSLDFRGEAFQGPGEILADETLWPSRVIVMTLARVGGGQGPDVAQLARVRTRGMRAGASAWTVYAAGGVRDRADLQALKATGAAGALVATALHNGAIGRLR